MSTTTRCSAGTFFSSDAAEEYAKPAKARFRLRLIGLPLLRISATTGFPDRINDTYFFYHVGAGDGS
jgi:hypothetical protein